MPQPMLISDSVSVALLCGACGGWIEQVFPFAGMLLSALGIMAWSLRDRILRTFYTLMRGQPQPARKRAGKDR